MSNPRNVLPPPPGSTNSSRFHAKVRLHTFEKNTIFNNEHPVPWLYIFNLPFSTSLSPSFLPSSLLPSFLPTTSFLFCLLFTPFLKHGVCFYQQQCKCQCRSCLRGHLARISGTKVKNLYFTEVHKLRHAILSATFLTLQVSAPPLNHLQLG